MQRNIRKLSFYQRYNFHETGANALKS